MAQQQRDVAELKRRALEAGVKRRVHLGRIEERRRGERERDRTVLRARVQEGEMQEEGQVEGNGAAVEGAASEVDAAPSVSVVKTVRRKKKARQADIQ